METQRHPDGSGFVLIMILWIAFCIGFAVGALVVGTAT